MSESLAMAPESPKTQINKALTNLINKIATKVDLKGYEEIISELQLATKLSQKTQVNKWLNELTTKLNVTYGRENDMNDLMQDLDTMRNCSKKLEDKTALN